MVQTVKGRKNQRYAGSGARNNATTTGGNRTRGTNTAGRAMVIRCCNCQEEGHMARQCTKPKRHRNSTWFKEKVMPTEALESRMVLNEEQMTFLANNRDEDAFDSYCDEAPSASVILMAKLSSYDSATLSEVPTYDNYLDNHVIDQNVQEMQYSEQPYFNNNPDIDITSDSNMISYEQYLNETKNTGVQDTSYSVQNDAMIIYKEQIKLLEERQKFDLSDREKYIDGQLRKIIVDKNAKVADFENHIHLLKQLNATVKSHKTLSTIVDVLKTESKVKEDKYLDEIIELEKQKKALDNVIYKMGQSTQTMHMLTKPQAFYDETHKIALGYQNPLYMSQAQRKVPTLCYGNTIVKQHAALSVIDTKKTLELA
ncbi:retrovirus-related pol polyprotein from transposon TNT 1-94 [Tanacetum coccineum]|uniref:Retrovirus-related pol polyprotein from transposon TNT 1-94 n=1 Tax=Tanacetum coccineum TaxID=301880 RepID=A0ABQ4YD82_9ASTR